MKKKQRKIYRKFKVKTKDKRVRGFRHNKAQEHYNKNKTNRDLILKARQLGFSTLIQLDHLYSMFFEKNTSSLTVCDTVPNARELFGKIRYAYDSLPEIVREYYGLNTKTVNKFALPETNCDIRVSTSGRSGTVHRLHISEFSKMTALQKDEVITGSLQAVPSDGHAVIETTARGLDEFYNLWLEASNGDNEWTPHFYGWYWADDYVAIPPSQGKWKDEYSYYAKSYGLIPDIQKAHKLTDEQFYWYYLKVRELRGLVKQEYPTVATEAFVTSGSTVFDTVELQKIQPSDPIDTTGDGDIAVWVEPKEGRDYIIGVDTSEGDIKSDYCVAAVLDVETAEQVAEVHGRYEDYVFAGVLSSLGKMYSGAMIAVERNNHGHSVINSLVNKEGYGNLYVAEDNKVGWLTNAKTKPLMITGANGLVEAVQEGQMKVNSSGFLTECMAYEYKPGKRGMGAPSGSHDDRVMAWAIAWQCRLAAMVPRNESGERMFVF